MKTFAAALSLILVCGWCRAALPTNDDFNSSTENTTNWAPDEVSGNGVLSLVNQRLEYRVNGSPTELDQSVRPWIASLGPYTSDWEVQIDTLNTVSLNATNQQVGTGIVIDGEAANFTNEILAIQFSGASAPNTPEVGFLGRKVVTLFYDADHSGGYSWTQFGSFGINGSGGTDANQSWGLTNSSQLVVRVYGYSMNTAVASNEVALDNFATTGLAAPLLPHDLSVVSIKAPTKITLSAKKPTIIGKATVTIQNLGPLTEHVTAENIANLVDFELQSLSPATCPAPVPVQ